ncbi:hypothetical protein EDC56_3547 [Sinobacterium caligoides]|uniref:Uncharacterized protein n=1 Tax=Sinobacterium caligoides TaxID=933926 RepID=A0A3N2DDK3_9GAMM|nr:hypothetical protein [Sinobacterium caligoides]ROR97880.1 hypothetical protein EDC56_3547 [Sinobacterium caligoides]
MMKFLLKILVYGLSVLIGVTLLTIFSYPIIDKYFPSYAKPHHDPKNWEVGVNGEPPFIHQVDYNQSYTVLYSDYLKAIDLLFSFSNQEGFHTIQFGECFKNVLNYSHKNEQLPCGAVYLEKGAPTKYLARLVITDKQILGCRYSGPNYINLDIVITSSGNNKLAKNFSNSSEKKFKELESKYYQLKESWGESNCRSI